MSDSTSNLDSVTDSQKSKATSVMELFQSASRALDFGKRGFGNSSGLTWAYYGTPRYYINGTAVTKANSTVSLTNGSDRYISADRALAVTEAATVFAPDKLALYKATTSGSLVTAHEDHRDPHHLVRFLTGYLSIAMADANVTLTYVQAMCDALAFTGSNTAQRDVIVPLVPRAYDVICSTTTNGIRVIGASGTGVTIAVGKSQRVFCDGTNVVAIGAPSP